jgi:hypothetical protein
MFPTISSFTDYLSKKDVTEKESLDDLDREDKLKKANLKRNIQKERRKVIDSNG